MKKKSQLLNSKTDIKTEYQPTTHYMDYITNKIDTTNKLSNTPETTEHIVIQSK